MTFPPCAPVFFGLCLLTFGLCLTLAAQELGPVTPLPGKARPLLDRAKVWVWIETLPCGAIPIVLEWIFLSQNLLSSTGVAQIFPLAISP